MAGITGKESLSIKKLDVAQSKLSSMGFQKIRFMHKATAGDTTINLASLTVPTEATSNGFAQPNASILNSLNLSQWRENFTLESSLRGKLTEFLGFTLSGANKINLLFSAEDGEIFTGLMDYVARTGNTIVDAQPLVVSGTLTAGSTDFNVGTPFQVGLYSSAQVGAVMVFVDNQLALRNSGNSVPGAGVEGDYYEVNAGGGLGQVIRFNQADLVNDRGIVVVSVGSLVERPNASQLALIQSLAGQVDSMIPTLAALAGVPATTFQGAPNDVNLKAFGDTVAANSASITSLQSTKQNLIETVMLKDIKASGVAGGSFVNGAWRTRVLNTLENPLSSTWISLVANQFTLQPGTYEFYGRAPAYRVAYHIAKLVNITDTTDTIIGSAGHSNEATANGTNDSIMDGIFTLSAAKTFEIQHRTGTPEGVAGSGFGLDAGSNIGVATNNVYTTVRIRKIR